jgi:hypothetical protein
MNIAGRAASVRSESDHRARPCPPRRSVDRIIKCSYQFICRHKISDFDQAQINSFIAGRSGKHDRMLMVKLAKSTFRAYKGIWKGLFCFVHRISQPMQNIPLLHRLTNAQLL